MRYARPSVNGDACNWRVAGCTIWLSKVSANGPRQGSAETTAARDNSFRPPRIGRVRQRRVKPTHRETHTPCP